MACELSRFTQLGKKIIGAGINYRSVVKERKLCPPEVPIVFMKPTSSYITEGHPIEIPEGFTVHHEVELGIIIGKRCKRVGPDNVLDYIAGYCLALDLTAVNQMAEARSKGMPWLLGKGFDTSCPVSKAIEKDAVADSSKLRLWLEVNGEKRQDSSTSDMIFPPAKLISFISDFMTLEPYDLILTGTPSGTGPIFPSDVVKAGLGDIVQIQFNVK